MDELPLPFELVSESLADGQRIAYTLTYVNEGRETATDVTLTLTPTNALRLIGSREIELGDIPAGTTGSKTIAALVQASALGTGTAELRIAVSDKVHGPFDWLWARHDVPSVPPKALEVTAPLKSIRPVSETIQIQGRVPDDAGLSMLKVEVRPIINGEPGAPTMISNCEIGRDWSCPWTPDIVADVTAFQLTAVSADIRGRTRPPTEWLVSVRPPELIFADVITSTYDSPGDKGARIALSPEPRHRWWTTVEWQDAFGDWHLVEGWRGEPNVGDDIVWWVAPHHLATGPYRWLIYQAKDGEQLGVTESFYLPRKKQQLVRFKVVLEH
jgi:hypothetical protein